jgi:hypothetical protein
MVRGKLVTCVAYGALPSLTSGRAAPGYIVWSTSSPGLGATPQGGGWMVIRNPLVATARYIVKKS